MEGREEFNMLVIKRPEPATEVVTKGRNIQTSHLKDSRGGVGRITYLYRKVEICYL